MNCGWLKCVVVALVIVLTMAPLNDCHADPAPAHSSYMKTFGGGFQYDRDTKKWNFFIYIIPLKKAPEGGPLYLVASFENPAPHALALVVKNDSAKAGKLGVEFRTPPVSGMRDRKKYVVTVQAFADKANTLLLDTLRQPVLYHDVINPDGTVNRFKVHLSGAPYSL